MDHYQRIADSLSYLAENYQEQPSLSELAARANMSDFHFQRVFTDWAGVSPKKFLQYVTLKYARQCLEDSSSILDTSLAVGLSSPSRLHDLFISVEGMSPGQFKSGGKGLLIDYGIHATPFGEALIMLSDRGVTSLVFTDGEPDTVLVNQQLRLPAAQYTENQERTAVLIDSIFARWASPAGDLSTVPLLLAGTPFQMQVWQALLTVPTGSNVTYGQIASHINRPSASRAVGTAIGANSIACLIPCHRVIRKSGLMGGYRWGEGRKLAILGVERINSVAR